MIWELKEVCDNPAEEKSANMVAEWPGNWSLSALDRKFQNLLFSALEKKWKHFKVGKKKPATPSTESLAQSLPRQFEGNCWTNWNKNCLLKLSIFSCPSSSIPTLVTHSLTHWLFWIQLQNFDQTIPNPTKTYNILECWPQLRILTQFQNFDWISEF